jgi:predicted nucleic acid-binding protein
MEANRKFRVYFDTTIPNMLFADDRPDWMEWTWRLWDWCVSSQIEVCVSDVFYRELMPAPQPKLNKMLDQLGLLNLHHISETDDIRSLAADYVRNGVLTQRRFNDCLHIANAVIDECDVMMSWNMDDLAKKSRLEKVKIVNAVSRYKGIEVVSPDGFLKGGR